MFKVSRFLASLIPALVKDPPSHFEITVQEPSGGSSGLDCWAIITTVCREGNHFLRKSPPLCLLVLSGLMIVETWATAFDTLGGGDAVDCLTLIQVAFQFIDSQCPSQFQDDEVPSQLVVILDKLGTGAATKGALGRLHTASTRLGLNSSGSSSISLGPNRNLISMQAASFITRNAKYLLYLFVAQATLGYGWQCIQTSNQEELIRFVSSLAHEYHRLALLTD